jgi:predicted O-methyltransferase YrrM
VFGGEIAMVPDPHWPPSPPSGPSHPPIPVRARHVELSALASADDDSAGLSDRLLDVALQAVRAARRSAMASVVERMSGPPFYPEVWPGEHYKLLAGLVAVCQPRIVIEIGTATGLSALAIRTALPPGSRLVTFDIVPWDRVSGTCLRATDFDTDSFRQVLGDVSDPTVMRQHASLFQSADLIFVDGPKDGRFERILLERFEDIQLPAGPLVVFDDIRLWNMLAIWRSVRHPKLDLTSFGHWSGTGLVDWGGAVGPR